MFGYEESELLGQPLDCLLPKEAISAHSAHLEKFDSSEDLSRNMAGRTTIAGVRKDGTRFEAEASISKNTIEGESLFSVYINDITRRKAVEEEERQAQQMQSLGVLAGGIAHDFNNILAAILGNTEMAKMELSPLSPVQGRLDLITQSSMRAADICRQMLAYSGKGHFVPVELSLADLVQEMFHLLEVSISKEAILKNEFAENLPAIHADSNQLRQVIMNLITNASEAIGDKSGVIAINVGAMQCDADYLDGTYVKCKSPPGVFTYVEVADTGSGMDKNTKSKLFEPFFTTKFTGRGLGLSAVLGVVRVHGGALKIYTEEGKGTTVKVLFPALDHEVDYEKLAIDSSIEAWKGSGTILLVDDEESIRAVTGELLRKKGFNVVTASDGREAMEIFSERKDEIVCVLLDLIMPHMDGEVTYREMRRIQPDVKVILCSGFSDTEINVRFAGKELKGYIQKPYRAQTLFDNLKLLLD